LLAQLILGGIAQGSIYALVALSMTVLYRATTIVNFGQGDLVMVAAFGVYVGVVLLGLPFALSVIAVLLLMFALGLGIERWLMRPIRTSPHLSLTMMTIGFGYLLRGIVRYFWGRSVLPIPEVFDFDPIILGDLVITADNIAVLVAVIAVLGMFFAVFYGTTLGQLVQAVFQSERGAQLIGMNVRRFHSIMWGVGALMGAITGVLIAPLTMLDPDLGAGVLMKAFAAMTLGGFGSLPGCVVGAIALGMSEQLLGAYVSTKLIDITAYLVIVLVLVARPSGLFGRRVTIRI